MSPKRPPSRSRPPPPSTPAPSRSERPARREDKTLTRPLREDQVTQVCLEVYGSIRYEGRLADRALEYTLRMRKHLYSSERRAVAERIYALLRRQRTVDWMLHRIHPALEQLPKTEQDVLRIATSRVLHGEQPRVVSRSMALSSDELRALEQLPDAAAALLDMPLRERFAIQGSLPDFLAERFLQEFGDEAEAVVNALNERAPLTARVNTLKATRDQLIQRLREEGVDCRPTPLSPLGVFLETRINAFSLNAFRDGWFELQDEGSQLLGMLVDPPPTRIVDACAGAGGKTLQLAAEMKNRGEIHALDIDEGRLEELKRRARRAGVHNTRTRPIPGSGEESLAAVHELEGRNDRVLVDAPCSGTGTFRRKPDGRYRLAPEDLSVHSNRQRDLLERFSRLVKPGGRMIYGTCSLLREENEAVIEDFLRANPDFSVHPAQKQLPEGVGEKVTRDGFLRLFPHRHGTDGFFGAILMRQKR